eukprot:TRINITY_DN21904_c0_g1_i1.p1 TRINITY_DN21904_c0_g1~~TRINITY_DN21904_c0_g1_i1.p1  ORF type:complete len:124 (-),score=21.30 TRINITY_DN21904_c0_g1_i1:74-445(-)
MTFQQDDQLQGGRFQDPDEMIIHETNMQTMQIAEDIQAVHEIQKESNQGIRGQQTGLDNIENGVTTAETKTEDTIVQLQQAEDGQNRARLKYVIIAILAVVLCLIILGVIVVVVAVVAGVASK